MTDEPIRVILVEDDEDDYFIFKSLLGKIRHTRYELEWAKGYDEALAAFVTGDFDIALVDYRLGGQTGLDVIRDAKRNGFNKPVIVLTGVGDEKLGVQALRAGAEDYLVKGEMTSVSLERAIRYAIERKEATAKDLRLAAEQAARKSLELQNERLESLLEQLQEREEALSERERHYARVISTLAEGIIIHDGGGYIQIANKGACKILGLPEPKLVGRHIKELELETVTEGGAPLPVEERPAMRALMTGEPQTNYTYGVVRGPKRVAWVLAHAIPLRKSDDDKPYAMVTSLTDITELKRLEQQKEHFISIASHELKTPVTSLKLFADIIMRQVEEVDHAPLAKSAATIQAQADRLVKLLEYLLDTSRIQTGRFELRKQRFDIVGLVADTVLQLEPTLPKHRVEFKRGAPIEISADRERLAQVVGNLISNAAKYSPEADKVVVKVKEVKGEVMVSVQDFGFGIPEAEQRRVFERFFRTEDARQKLIPGIGIGLFISSEIVRRHKGRVWVESKLGKGSTFYFSLPLGT